MTSPTATPLSVMARTSRPIAIICIQVPVWLMIWPTKNSRKLRLRSERKVSEPKARMRVIGRLAGP